MKHRAAPEEPQGVVGRARLRVLVYLVFALGALGFSVLTLVSPVRQLWAQQERIDTVRREAARVEAENRALRKRIAELNQDSTIERLAREEFGLVKPGEEAYVLLPPGAPGAPVPPPIHQEPAPAEEPRARGDKQPSSN